MVESINTSRGLALSLELVQQHRVSGLLQADLPQALRIAQPCVANLHLSVGELTACYLEDWQSRRISVEKEELCCFDEENGPFEWILFLSPPPAVMAPLPGEADSYLAALPIRVRADAIPELVAPVPRSPLMSWTASQWLLLHTILPLIDGQRSLQEITAHVDLRAALVEEAILVLVALKVVVLHCP